MLQCPVVNIEGSGSRVQGSGFRFQGAGLQNPRFQHRGRRNGLEDTVGSRV